jgi:hypothetical protein
MKQNKNQMRKNLKDIADLGVEFRVEEIVGRICFAEGMAREQGSGCGTVVGISVEGGNVRRAIMKREEGERVSLTW